MLAPRPGDTVGHGDLAELKVARVKDSAVRSAEA
jgi:hypothetical protein